MNEYSQLSDEQLMVKYIADDYPAFEQLYARHKGTVYSYLKKRIQDSFLVDEIFQKVFLKLHHQRFNYDPKKIFIKWLYVITKTVFIDEMRKRKVVVEEFNDDLPSPSTIEKDLDLDDYKSLTSTEKEVIDRRFLYDQEYEEIACALSKNQTNIRKILSRALSKMRKEIGLQSE